jgi:hypothetical protein
MMLGMLKRHPPLSSRFPNTAIHQDGTELANSFAFMSFLSLSLSRVGYKYVTLSRDLGVQGT